MDKRYTSVRLEITSKCNLNCSYCHNAKFANRNDDMSTDDIKQLISNLKKSNNINKVLLTGGEPLVNKDVVDLVTYITSLGIKCDMVTNGILMTEKMMLDLDKAGLKRVRLSIDDVTTNNINRNIDSTIIIKKIKQIVEKTNIEVCVHSVVTPQNVDTLFDLYKVVLLSGAKRWRVFDIGYQGNVVDNNSQQMDLSSYYQRLIKTSKKIITDYLENNYIDKLDIEINNIFKTSFLKMKTSDYDDFDFDKEYDRKMNLSPCNYVTNHQMTVRSNGDVTLCQYFRNPISHFKNGKIIDSKIIPREETTKLKDIEYCKNCKYVLNCNSGCRSRAQFFTGSLDNPDPTACVLHTLVSSEIIPILPDNVKKIYNLYLNKNGNEPLYHVDDLNGFLIENGFMKE